jgi:polyphosphate kinase 2 (PPK2 family)
MAGNKKRARQEVAAVESDERMSNKDYLKELYRLHVELVKLQEWVLKKAPRSASCSRAATAPARAARSRPSPSA